MEKKKCSAARQFLAGGGASLLSRGFAPEDSSGPSLTAVQEKLSDSLAAHTRSERERERRKRRRRESLSVGPLPPRILSSRLPTRSRL